MSSFEEFRKNGYVVLKNVLEKENIFKLRKLAFSLFDEKERRIEKDGLHNAARRSLYTETFLKNQEIMNIAFHKEVVEEIKQVLGNDYITFTQFSLGSNLHSPIWHTDAQSQGPAEYLYSPLYNVAKCGLYLQEDDKDYGGGLEIIAKSHLPSCLGSRSFVSRDKMYGKVSGLQLRAMELRKKYLKKIRLKLESGDVLLFDSLLWHRASQPNWQTLKQIYSYGIKTPPKEKHKFMIQWEVSQNNDFASVYATHQQLRGLSQKNGLFKESNDVVFPKDFPRSTLDLIESNNCNVVGYSEIIKNIETNNYRAEDGTPIQILFKEGQ